jgi:hypothetical protein
MEIIKFFCFYIFNKKLNTIFVILDYTWEVNKMWKKILVIIICIQFTGIVSTALGEKNKHNFNTFENTFKNIGNLGTVEVIDQQQIFDCGEGCPFFSNLWLAQGFTPTLETITRAELKLFKAGGITSDIIFSIKSTLTGSDLTSVSISGSQVSGTSKWIEFDFTDISVIPDQPYYIVCRTLGGSFTEYYCCLFQVDNPYLGGEVWGSLNSGASWQIIEYPGYPDPDGCFKIYGLDETPNIPNIDGPATGKPGIDLSYIISATDPENHDVFYKVEWGDNTNTGWLGPYNSGEEISLDHQWKKQGKYEIKVKARDIYGAESEMEIVEVTIPRTKTSYFTFLNQLFEKFPLLEKLFIILK